MAGADESKTAVQGSHSGDISSSVVVKFVNPLCFGETAHLELGSERRLSRSEVENVLEDQRQNNAGDKSALHECVQQGVCAS